MPCILSTTKLSPSPNPRTQIVTGSFPEVQHHFNSTPIYKWQKKKQHFFFISGKIKNTFLFQEEKNNTDPVTLALKGWKPRSVITKQDQNPSSWCELLLALKKIIVFGLEEERWKLIGETTAAIGETMSGDWETTETWNRFLIFHELDAPRTQSKDLRFVLVSQFSFFHVYFIFILFFAFFTFFIVRVGIWKSLEQLIFFLHFICTLISFYFSINYLLYYRFSF